MSVLDRLLAKVKKNPVTCCWEWTACRDRNGYGRFQVDGQTELAHRVSHELHHGKIPQGLLVCHRCDNPRCINPEHLFLGTQADNMADMNTRGRHDPRKGTSNAWARLSNNDICAIRAAIGVRQADLAKKYGVGQSQISRIRSGERWGHF